jgi:hypothetical protein
MYHLELRNGLRSADLSGISTFVYRWRATFWLLAGLSAIPAIGIAVLVKKRPIELSRADRRIDWLGAALFVVGFIMLFFSLSQARSTKYGWGTDCSYFHHGGNDWIADSDQTSSPFS